MRIHKTIEKWCPMVKYASGTVDNNSANRWLNSDNETADNNPETCRCIADHCMMWRWKSNSFDEGYCGLAGKEEVNLNA